MLAGHLDEPLSPDLEGRVDVITAVGPYVPTEDMRLLPRDVRQFEPRMALDGGREGTDLLREVAGRSPRWLRPGGWLLLEIGGRQPELLAALLDRRGFENVEVMRDEEGDPRAICACRDGHRATARAGPIAPLAVNAVTGPRSGEADPATTYAIVYC